MNLTEAPKIVTWPATHYVYVEKIGPFMETAREAWGGVHQLVPAIAENNTITGYTTLYKMAAQIYRAGVSLAAEPVNLPEGLTYVYFEGGKYSQFVLNGSYSELPEACGRVFDIVAQTGIEVADNFYIENYVTDPRTIPDDENVIKILVPTV